MVLPCTNIGKRNQKAQIQIAAIAVEQAVIFFGNE